MKISTIGCLPLTGAMLFGLLLLKTHTALAATYNVTANTCQGPGSIVEAIQLANPHCSQIHRGCPMNSSALTDLRRRLHHCWAPQLCLAS